MTRRCEIGTADLPSVCSLGGLLMPPEDYYAGTLSNRLLPMVPGLSLTKVPMISLPVEALASIADHASPLPLPNSVPST